MLLCPMHMFNSLLLTKNLPLLFGSTSVAFQANGMNMKCHSVLPSCLVISASYCHAIHFKSGKVGNLDDTSLVNQLLENYDDDRNQSWTYFSALSVAMSIQLHREEYGKDMENIE